MANVEMYFVNTYMSL